jgi:hypothetical protein
LLAISSGARLREAHGETATSRPMPRKKTERFQLERFLLNNPGFSGVEIKDHERPDFIVAKHGSPFGIEVVQLYHPAVNGSFALRQVEAFREKIIDRARVIYEQRKAPAVDVGVMFSDMVYAPTDLELRADELATFVQRAYPLDRPWVIYTDDNSSNMPAAFTMLSISKRDTEGFWHMMQCRERAVLSRTIIQDAIDAKNRLVPDYRLKIPTVWLLLVMDALYLSSSFTVLDEIVRVPYSCAFDRAFLFSVVDGRAWPLVLRPASLAC